MLLLLELHERLNRSGRTTKERFACPPHHYPLADALGMTAVYLNRTLRRFRERGLVTFRHGHVRFPNRRALADLAEFRGDMETNVESFAIGGQAAPWQN